MRCTEVGLRAPHETVGACALLDVVHTGSRRTVKEGLPVQALKALAREAIEIDSPALTLVRYPTERTWKENT